MKKDLFLSLLLTFTLLPYVHLSVSQQQAQAQAAQEAELRKQKIPVVTREFGFRLDSFQLQEHRIRDGQTLGDLLQNLQVAYPNVLQVVNNCQGVFNYKNLRAGHSYYVVTPRDSLVRDSYFVYQPSPTEYFTIALQDSFRVQKTEKPVQVRTRTAGGEIQSSLWNAMTDNNMDPELAVELSEIYAWTVNFFGLQKGDRFKLIFEEKLVDNTPIASGKIQAAYFYHGGKEFYAIPFEQDGDHGFFDQDGKSLEADFLKSPVKYSRISSGFTMHRFHPVQKRWKAHLGTDFAAPTGTPIYSTANGTVVEATFTRNNGNYVKVKHNQTISTQYLHMSRIADGIRAGRAVRQGEVIGYVGSTGLASGPHVCYRFWMNGQQVNSQQVKISAMRKIKDEYRAAFDSTANVWMQQLQQFELATDQQAIYAQATQAKANGQSR